MRKKLLSILALLLTVSGAWADDEKITVYFSNNKGWDNVNIHYWGGSSSTDWPGVSMTLVEWNNEGEGVYSADIPANTKGIVFNYGSAKSNDIETTSSFVNGTHWYLTGNNSPYNYGNTDAPHTPVTYFIASCENDAWTIRPNNKLQPNKNAQKEYFIENVELPSGTKIKVVSSEDNGTTIKDKYPADNYNPYQISIDATYSIYCKPYVGSGESGGDNWYYNILVNPTAVTLDEDGNNNSDIIDYLNNKTVAVTLKRTLKANGWNTFCVPFQLTSKPAGWSKVKYLTSSSYSNNELTLNFADVDFTNGGSILPGRPYLVKVSENVVNPTFNGVGVSNYTETTQTPYANFVPVMSSTPLTGGDKNVLFITNGNTLTYPLGDGDIKGFRAYFGLNSNVSGARAFTMSFDDDATGITTVLSDETTAGSGTYTLDGRRIEGKPTQKGVYIVNGKKTIIK